MKYFFSAFFCFIFFLPIRAQKDTEFWFVAPDILENPPQNYDRPTAFRVSTYDQPATVTIFQPANPNFSVLTQFVAANSTATFEISSDIMFVENFPPNVVLNKGILIRATADISVYYEILGGCLCNPEIFSLKGRNAIGSEFYVPFQTSLDNSSFSPAPNRWSAFDIVATKNNTEITITPTQDIVGHAANVPFSITLQLGQTWSGRAMSPEGSAHPAGTHITSNKSIAVTMKDDLVNGEPLFSGSCRNLIGDQIIPVSKTGKQYVVQKGELNNIEFGFVLATENNTDIRQDGQFIGTISAGEQKGIAINSSHYIETTKPVYVLQITGIGCEVSGEVLPPLECSGSNSIRFFRTTEEPFYLMFVTRKGNESSFQLNGSNNWILPSNFSIVPGSNDQWVAAKIEFGIGIIPSGVSNEIKNTKGVFHMGLLNGMESATGSRFGFFSDFGNTVIQQDSTSICIGDTIGFRDQIIFEVGTYSDTVMTESGCDTIFKLIVLPRQYLSFSKNLSLCSGDFVVIDGVQYTEDAVALDTIAGNFSCDTIFTYLIEFNDFILKNRLFKFCQGDTIVINGVDYWLPVEIQDTLIGNIGCDTILVTKLEWISYLESSRTLILCPGQTIEINGSLYASAGIVIDTLRGIGNDCDTIRTTNISIDPFIDLLVQQDTFICTDQIITLTSPFFNTTWNSVDIGPSYNVTTTGIVSATALSSNQCELKDSIFVRPCCAERGIYVPNIFTPDEPGNNAVFKVNSIEQCRNFTLRIYSRWGELLFEQDDLEIGWDGKFRGRPMGSGVYIWTLTSNNKAGNEPIVVLSGDLSLIR